MIPYSQTLTKFQHKDTQGQLQELLEQLMILQQDTSRGSTVLVKKLERGVQSAITATASELRLEVKRTDESQRAYIDVNLGQIKAAVQDEDGNYTVLKLTADGGLQVGNNAGTTTISGANITAGTITLESLHSDVTNAISNAESAASSAGSAAYSALFNIRDLANGNYTGGSFISGRGIVTPKLYAASGDLTQFAEMLPDGFATYHQPEGGSAYRKILLGYSNKSRTDNSGTLCPALYLGSVMPLKLEKYFESGNRAWIGNEDEDCGIRFNMNTKEMTFVGTVNATISGGTTHVFA